MKREQHEAPENDQKRQKRPPAPDQSGKESPMSKHLSQATVDSSDTVPNSSRAGPTIVINDGTEDGFASIETKSEPEIVKKVSEKDQVSFSPSPKSFKALDSTPRPQSPAEQSFIPSTITCNLLVTFENLQHRNEFSVPLHEPESYQRIEGEAETHAKILSAKSIGSKELKFSYGNCTIVSHTGTKTRHPLRSAEDWSKVYKAVVGYWNSQTREVFRLFISRHYLVSQEKPIVGKSFAKEKKLEIYDRLQTAWEKETYIARNVLEMVISDEAIKGIIKEGPPNGLTQEQQDAFILDVQAKGRILSAMCINASLTMDCLKKLLDSGLKDSTLPLEEKNQCHRDCRAEFAKLVKCQGGFQAERFVVGEHKTLHSHAVVPLHFCSRADAKGDIDREVTEICGDKAQSSPKKERASKEDAWCGAGAYSNVYCVKLNPDHHSLSEDLNACFALKEFKDRPKLAENFDRELAMLKELRKYSHPHIVTDLATWTQDRGYYMLFPYAQCNLREYMQQNEFTERDAFWLLDQFRGMANAVKRIHDLEIEASTSTLDVKTSIVAGRKTGWHHDIKPENILYFKDSPSNRGMFRISDWGSAKVNTYRTRSYHTKSLIGTITYEPPEFTYQGETSRPYDLWSLGCVFLELLIWAVFGPTNIENFSGQRDDKRDANSVTGSMRDDAFWQKVGDKYVLKKIVVTELQRLDKALAEPGKPPFKEVVGYIRRMLELDLDKRIRALELCDLLDRTSLTKVIEAENPRDESEPSAHMTLIPPNTHLPEQMVYGNSPSNRSSGPAYAENYDLSPSDMSPPAGRHSRNNSASEFMRSNATHSRQSSDASIRSTLSVRERRGSHSSATSPRTAERGA